MKSKWVWLMAVMMLVMLGCLTMWSVEKRGQSELVVGEGGSAGKNCVGERLGRSEGVVERIGWREGVGEWRRRGRPYRNPLRRYRVGKKVRVQLRRRITGMIEKGEGLSSFSAKEKGEWHVERALLADANVESER